MNTLLLALGLFVTLVAALPAISYRDIEVVSQAHNRDDNGQFVYRYLFGDGTELMEQGSLKRTADGKDNVLVKKGSYRYLSPEGKEVRVEYTADETGFHPVSMTIPRVQTVLR